MMRKKIHQGKRQKNKLRSRLLLACVAGTLFITIAGSLLVFLNINNLSKTRASGTGAEGGGNNLNNGEIISEFYWDKNPVTSATLGPDGSKVSKTAHSVPGGRSSTQGLSAGDAGKDINLEIEASEIFKQDGLDISIDFRRNEESGDFFTRGNIFNFGMENGFITIKYSIENKLGKIESLYENTQYEIPADPVFRTYRFIYRPSAGKAEIFVNGIVIWQHENEINSPLAWKNGGSVIIGRGMNGEGLDLAIFDNLIVRSTGSVSPLAESLLNFMLESKDGGVKVHWSSSINEKVDHFTIERSINGIDFVPVANINARPDTINEEEYTYIDKSISNAPLLYYRMRQTFKNGKNVTHALSAIKFKSDKEFSIERVNPSQFQKSCDISYYLPKPGRVWMQLSDEKGKVLNTSSFDAKQGKNVYVFKDEVNIQSGTYTLSLIFDNKKESRKVVKI